MRSQANTAKLLADNPTLMRLRELEVLEKVAASSKLNILLGVKGLMDLGDESVGIPPNSHFGNDRFVFFSPKMSQEFPVVAAIALRRAT
jgi:hypothetical protein